MRPVKRALLLVTIALEFCTGSLLTGCGSGGSGGNSNPDAGAKEAGKTKDARAPRDVAPDVILDPENCVRPGSPGYCSPGGGQCLMAGPGGTLEDCTADLPETPAHAWYCTLPCSRPSDCSGTSSCKATPTGSRCVPMSCESLLPEAGADAPGEAAGGDGGIDGAADSGADASDAGAKDAPSETHG